MKTLLDILEEQLLGKTLKRHTWNEIDNIYNNKIVSLSEQDYDNGIVITLDNKDSVTITGTARIEIE